jgi:hypothetical protein
LKWFRTLCSQTVMSHCPVCGGHGPEQRMNRKNFQNNPQQCTM